MKFLNNIFTKIRQNKSYFLKMHIAYSIFAAIVIIAFAFIILMFSNRTLEKEIYATNLSMLSQAKIFVDSVLVDKMNWVISEKFSGSNLKITTGEFFINTEKLNSYEVYVLQKKLESIKANSNYVDSVYVYRKDDNALISSEDGFFTYNKPSSETYNTQNYPLIYYNIATDFAKTQKSQVWIYPNDNKINGVGKNILSFIKSVPLDKSVNNATGCVLINIDMDKLQNGLKTIMQNDKYNFFIIDENKKMIYDSLNIFSENDGMDKISNVIFSKESYNIINHDGKKYLICQVKSAARSWKYAIVVNIDSINNQILKVTILVLFLLVIIIIILQIGFSFITKNIYKPIKQLIRKTQEMTHTSYNNNTNEFAYINNFILELTNKVSDMENTLAENQELIEYRICMDMANGNINNNQDMNKKLEVIGTSFDLDYYTILLVEINNELLDILPQNQQEYALIKTNKLISTFLSKKFSCISACYSSNGNIVIINHLVDENLVNYTSDLLDYLKNNLDIQCNIAISDKVNNLTDFKKAFYETGLYFKYSFIYNYNNVFTPEFINKAQSYSGNFTLENLQRFEKMLKLRKVPLIKEEIFMLFENFKSQGYSYNYVQSIIIQIINLICNVSSDMNIEIDNVDKEKIINKFYLIMSLDKCYDWILLLLDSFDNGVAKRDVTIVDEYFNKILEYIDENIGAEISLSSVAKKFQISTNYFSKFFKVNTGTNFSNYVADKKLEKAAYLLISNKKLDIEEISTLVGYSKTSYFHNLFKKKYGMTPIQYRKTNQKEQIGENIV